MDSTSKDIYSLVKSMVMAAMYREENPTGDAVRNLISKLTTLPGYELEDEQLESLAREVESKFDISMALGPVVQKQFKEWLSAAKQDIDPYYWERYRQLLVQKEFPPKVISRLDEVTDRILGLLENPSKEGPWDRRGMVVGHVQSGKTANYTGLLTKAADAGYQLIIVIAGIHNNLRNQTQERIDEGFVGRDSANLLGTGASKKYVGVGKIDKQRIPVTVTTSKQDFNKQSAQTFGVQLKTLSEPAVLVVKKNTNTLKNLIGWLRELNASAGTHLVDAPMLIIDDEADNASIDISKSPEEASRINGQIRLLLQLFNRKCYVGYTATPFANIFIDPESELEMIGSDLFPRDFIIGLEAPSNYFGPTRIFGEPEGRNTIRSIDDNEDILPIKHPKGYEVNALPISMEHAICAFILAKAIRIIRGQGRKHHSMLVNVSRFVDVQKQLRDLVHDMVSRIGRHIRYEYKKSKEEALNNSEIRKLYSVWEDEYSTTGVDWQSIQNVLHEAASSIQIVEINSRSAGSLNYDDYSEDGLNVIAIGGFSLSRGLTLEGLTVSYFLRNSMMYDTLMQMGRWFGYRPEYEDLCRVWMTEEAAGWYEHVTDSTEELRNELMHMEKAKMTPEQFGLKVRSHPDSLIVTARNKMGSAERVFVKIGLSNQFIETALLSRKSADIETNRITAKTLIQRIVQSSTYDEKYQSKSGNYLWKDVSVDYVTDFIGAFRNYSGSRLTESKPVQTYIEKRLDEGELKEWDIVVISKQVQSDDDLIDDSLGIEVRCQERSAGKQTSDEVIYVSSKQRVSSRGVEKIGLTEETVEKAEEEYRRTLNKAEDEPVNFPDRIYRSKREKPLLIVHMLKIKSPKKEDEEQTLLSENAVVAWSMSLPTSKTEDSTVEYVVNTTWWNETYGRDVDEEEEMESE